MRELYVQSLGVTPAACVCSNRHIIHTQRRAREHHWDVLWEDSRGTHGSEVFAWGWGGREEAAAGDGDGGRRRR